MTEIVVGADGSAPSNRALAWAWQEARLRDDAALVVVHAYPAPARREPSPYAYSFLSAEMMERLATQNRTAREELETIARQHAEGVLRQALDAVGVDDSGPVVKRAVVVGDPARALVEMSREADMVVVGRRGPGRIPGPGLGSVSQHLLHHARCPVLVVR